MKDLDDDGYLVCPVCGAVIEVAESGGHKIPIVHNVEIKRPQPLFRLHTFATHISIGLLPLAILATFIALILNISGHQNAIHFNKIGLLLVNIALVGAVATFATGWTDWKRKYRGRTYEIIRKKITLSIFLIILLTITKYLGCSGTDIGSLKFYTYLGLQMVSMGLIGMIGHYGGYLVFGK
ncbi:hypothetical protein HN814_12355 [Candidatus Woesearchaeota archaeon]|nr:hypothetical protein [Candidatus Woesearchaeota archaeon]